MLIGDRLRDIRGLKKLSQGDVETRTGLLRCYISRVENGHTVPSLETLERMARAFEIPMYHLFYDGENPPELPVTVTNKMHRSTWGSRGKDARYVLKLQRCLGRMDKHDRRLLLGFAHRLVQRKKKIH